MSQQIGNPKKLPYKVTTKNKLIETRKLCLRMDRPIPDINLRDISKLNEGDTRVSEDKSYFDFAVDKITSNKSSRNLIFGTFSGWLAGITVIRVGKIAAFGFGGGIILLHFASELGYINVNWERVRESARQSQASLDYLVRFVKKNSCYSVGFAGGFFFGRSSIPVTTLPPAIPEPIERPPVPPDPVMPAPLPLAPTPKPVEPFKPTEDPNMFLEKPPFLAQPKPIPHSPKISPSSIPNPSPSVSTTKQMEPGYPNYGSYLYSIPGYSAFQPVSYPGMVQPNQAPIVPNEVANKEFIPFPSMAQKENPVEEASKPEIKKVSESQPSQPSKEMPKVQTDFEEQFTPEIIPAVSMPEVSQNSECKMSITSLTQGSGATVTIPTNLANKDSKMKTTERFSLKTSIPISKIDLKCVNNPPDAVFQNSLTKKVPVTQTFQTPKPEQHSLQTSRVEIQSNIVIKTAKESENKEIKSNPPSNSISTLLNAAEAINKTESQFRKPEQIPDVPHEAKDPAPPLFTTQVTNSIQRPIFNPINMESNKGNYPNKPPDGSFNEQKNQILFIQNKNTTNPKMLLTIQQQNPQVLLQRTNFESKNLQAPSRLSNQSKKCKDEIVNDNGTSSKVVALKRLHQENCDENDFENLITENQIYGNKIVVKEKSQGTQQEQDLKNKINKGDKPAQAETKNVVLQPNFLYLSNVQIPGNFMMIKNNTKLTQTNDNNKTSNENKTTEIITPTNNTDSSSSIKVTKTQNVAVSKEIHVLKSSNNVLQTLSNKNSKTDLVFQTTNQKVIMNPQIVYQVPMIVDTDNKINQQFNNKEYPKYVAQNKKDFSKPFEQPVQNDKLFIACPYQMDSKLQPKIVITNIRPKISKVEEVSSLDIYEKRRRLRRLKYLSNRETKEQKLEINKKAQEKTDVRKNIITPKKMTIEICKEFASAKLSVDECGSDSDTDYGEDELKVYNKIIKEYADQSEQEIGKIKFLSGLSLATHKIYKEKEMEKQERTLKFDSVASAYIAAGRLDKIMNEDRHIETFSLSSNYVTSNKRVCEDKEQDNEPSLQRKLNFLSQLKLVNVTEQHKDGYEKAWQEILKERKRRSGGNGSGPKIKQPRADVDLDPNGQLQILTEIKKCVNENNNLIKMRLDSSLRENEGDSIKVLAEKNFSELNRLSKMADRSVKLFSGQETRKRDLNPGFDSENIKKVYKLKQKIYPSINIPNISKIISLKTTQESNVVVTTQATSMDEPQSCAAGVKEMFTEPEVGKTQDFSCQVEEASSWLGVEAMVKCYREYDSARRKEIADLHRRNTSLRVECAHVTRAASRDSDRARALLAERQNLATEETSIRASIQKLCAAVRAIRSS